MTSASIFQKWISGSQGYTRLKGKNQSGPAKWWQELQFSYTAQLDNQISTKDSLLFTSKVWENMKSGFTHEAPLSLQIRPFRNFSISPQLSYKGVLYTQKVERIWDPEQKTIVRDTLQGYFYGQALNAVNRRWLQSSDIRDVRFHKP